MFERILECRKFEGSTNSRSPAYSRILTEASANSHHCWSTKSASYLILEDTLYEVSSVLRAFETTLEICFCLNCEYPFSALPFWIFLQQAYFNIKTFKDKPSTELNALIGEIRGIIAGH